MLVYFDRIHINQCEHGKFYPRLSVMWFQSWRSSWIWGGRLHNTWRILDVSTEIHNDSQSMFNKIKLCAFLTSGVD